LKLKAKELFSGLGTKALDQERELLLLDIFLHMDLKSDNFITFNEM
jgi:hypothetical protein